MQLSAAWSSADPKTGIAAHTSIDPLLTITLRARAGLRLGGPIVLTLIADGGYAAAGLVLAASEPDALSYRGVLLGLGAGFELEF